eukprot:933250-Karenia_brevis.AAC.1
MRVSNTVVTKVEVFLTPEILRTGSEEDRRASCGAQRARAMSIKAYGAETLRTSQQPNEKESSGGGVTPIAHEPGIHVELSTH